MGFDYAKAANTKGGAGRKPFIEANIEALMVVTLAKLIEGGHNGNSYVFEFKVIESKGIAVGVVPPPKAAERAYVVDLDNKDYGLPNLMSVAEALEGGQMPGLTEDQKKALLAQGKSITEVQDADSQAKGNALKQLLAEAKGMLVRVSSNGVKKKDGGDFTALTWGHVPGQTLESVRETRAKLDGGAFP